MGGHSTSRGDGGAEVHGDLQRVERDARVLGCGSPSRVDTGEETHSDEHPRDLVGGEDGGGSLSVRFADLCQIDDRQLDVRVEHRSPERVDALAQDRGFVYPGYDEREHVLLDTQRSQGLGCTGFRGLRNAFLTPQDEPFHGRRDRLLRELLE